MPKCIVGSFLYDANNLLPGDFLSKIIGTVFLLSTCSLQSGTQDSLGADGFFDLLSRFQGNRLEDQRCSLLDSPSRLPPPSPSSTPPVAERKRELALLCCVHTICYLSSINMYRNALMINYILVWMQHPWAFNRPCGVPNVLHPLLSRTITFLVFRSVNILLLHLLS